MIGDGLFAVWGNMVLLAWAGLALCATLPRSGVWGRRLATLCGFHTPVVLSICWAMLILAAIPHCSSAAGSFRMPTRKACRASQ